MRKIKYNKKCMIFSANTSRSYSIYFYARKTNKMRITRQWKPSIKPVRFTPVNVPKITRQWKSSLCIPYPDCFKVFVLCVELIYARKAMPTELVDSHYDFYLRNVTSFPPEQTSQAVHRCHNWTRSSLRLRRLWFFEIFARICRLPKR